MTRDQMEVVVGMALLIAFMLVLAFSYGSREYGGSGYALTGVFNRVDGLVVGDQVQISGVRVGTVDGMSLDERYRALVTLRIDPGVQVPADSDAAVHTDGLFGRKFVVLGPGGDAKMLGANDRIDYTQGSVLVDELLEQIIAEGKAHRRKPASAGKGGR